LGEGKQLHKIKEPQGQNSKTDRNDLFKFTEVFNVVMLTHTVCFLLIKPASLQQRPFTFGKKSKYQQN
jgi:hypothetical protein